MSRFSTTDVSAAAGLAVLFWFSGSGSAHAYIDPGTGGMLLQLLLGGIAGALVVMRLYWARLKATVQRLFGKSGNEKPSED